MPKIPSFWNDDHPLSRRYDVLWRRHVPRSGTTQSVEGEIFRAASKILHDFYNNGFGNNWSGPFNLLHEHQSDLERLEPGVREAMNVLRPYRFGSKLYGGDFEGDPTERAVNTIVAAATKLLSDAERAETLRKKNFDMYDYQESVPYNLRDVDSYNDEYED